MPKRRTLSLTSEERRQLEDVRDHHPKPYMREKAAAMLKIADGMSAHQVALHGLLKPRDPDVVYGWLNRYLMEGVAGLEVREGRGRKPKDAAAAKAARQNRARRAAQRPTAAHPGAPRPGSLPPM